MLTLEQYVKRKKREQKRQERQKQLKADAARRKRQRAADKLRKEKAKTAPKKRTSYPLDHTREIPRRSAMPAFLDLSECTDPDLFYDAIFAFQEQYHRNFSASIRLTRDQVTLDNEGNMHVSGKLELTNFNGLLPRCLASVGYLWLRSSGITCLPDRLTRVGALDLSRTYALASLPEGLHIDTQLLKRLSDKPGYAVTIEGSTLLMERLAREAGIEDPRWEDPDNCPVVPKGRVLWEIQDENGLRVAYIQRTGGKRVMLVNRRHSCM